MNTMVMRDVFGEALVELGRANEEVVVLDADLAHATRSSSFADNFPERFFNLGIAEQNMVSLAAGMASCGKLPFVCTFAFLLALRASDQIRSHVAYPNLNVKLVGGNPGLTGSFDGATHQSVMDLAVMRAMPRMTVLVPSDDIYTRQAVFEAAKREGPIYMRISRLAARRIHEEGQRLIIGKGDILRRGDDVTLVATGTMVEKALDAQEKLAVMGISAELVEMSTLKPFDAALLEKSLKRTGACVTIEEHSRIGGLYSAVVEAMADAFPVPVEWIAVDDRFGESGTYEELLSACHLTVEDIVKKTLAALKKKRRTARSAILR